MVEKLNLANIVFYAVSASLREAAETDTSDDGMVTSYNFRIRHVGNEFGVRFRTTITVPPGNVDVDIAAEYVSDSPLLIPSDAVSEYVNNVALMQVFPYIRVSVMSLTARVFGEALLLPVFERGQLAFDHEDVGPELSDGSANIEQ